MATVLDRVPVDEITARAREIRFARVALTLLALPFFVLGWVAGHAWLAFCWCAVAVKAGWLESKRGRDGAG